MASATASSEIAPMGAKSGWKRLVSEQGCGQQPVLEDVQGKNRKPKPSRIDAIDPLPLFSAGIRAAGEVFERSNS